MTRSLGLDLYVSPEGSDEASGTQEKPLQSIAAAVQKMRKATLKEKDPRIIILENGTHYLKETLD